MPPLIYSLVVLDVLNNDLLNFGHPDVASPPLLAEVGNYINYSMHSKVDVYGWKFLSDKVI